MRADRGGRSRAWRLAVLGATLLVGCAGAPRHAPVAASPAAAAPAPQPLADDPPAVPGAKPLDGPLEPGETRPVAVGALRFDVGMLPVATWGRADRRTGFKIATGEHRFQVTIRGPVFAEIVVASRQPTSSFEIFTGGTFGSGEPPKCGNARLGSSPAYWTGISAKGWTDSAVTVEMGRGDFDARTCAGEPRASLAAQAGAIVPGYVYGLRVRIPATALEAQSEQLVVFLPRGTLVSAAVDPAFPLRASDTGAFTRLTLPLDPGTTGSASVRLSPASLGLWTQLRVTGRPVYGFKDEFQVDSGLLVGVDVVSTPDKRLGSLVVSLPSTAYTPSFSGLIEAVMRAGG